LNFAFTEEQKQIRTLVRDFCEKEVDQKRINELLRKNDAVKTIDEVRANYPWDLREKAHKLGLLTIGVPTKYGGPGPDTEPNIAIAVALEEAGYIGGPVTELLSMTWIICNCVATAPIPEEQKEWFFSQFIEKVEKKDEKIIDKLKTLGFVAV